MADSAGDGTPTGLIERIRAGVARHPWYVVGAAALLAGGLGAAINGTGGDLVGAQRMTVDTLAEFVAAEGRGDLQTALGLDMAFVLVYGLGLAFLIRAVRPLETHSGPVRGRQNSLATVGRIAIVGTMTADLVENTLLWAQLRRFGPGGSVAVGLDQHGDGVMDWMRRAGLVKWGLATVTLLVIVEMLRRKLRTSPFTAGLSTAIPDDSASSDWTPPVDNTPRRGVCLSGGGIRSASFSLGAMQTFERRGHLENTHYLAAVSGGGYLAAGWSVARGLADTGPDGSPTEPPPEDPTAWSPGSPEERRFRDTSSYLVPDVWQGANGMVRLLAGIIVNLILVWAVLFAVARPIGWAIGIAHPEMRPKTPLTLPVDIESGFAIGDLDEIQPLTLGDDGATITARRYLVDLVPAESVPDKDLGAGDNRVCFNVAPFQDDQETACYPITVVERGLIQVEQGTVEVLRDPEVSGDGVDCSVEANTVEPGDVWEAKDIERCERVRSLLVVEEQPELKADRRAVVGTERELKDRLSVSAARITRGEQPDRGDPAYPPWMWVSAGGMLALGVLIGLAVMLLHPVGRTGRTVRYGGGLLFVAGLLWFTVFIGLPWLLNELPDRVSALSEETNGIGVWLRETLIVPAGGFIALATAALSQYKPGGGSASEETGNRSWWSKLRRSAGPKLAFYELSFSKILAGLALVLVPLFLLVGVLQYAVANGPNGRLFGIARLQTALPTWLEWLEPDWVRWSLAVLALTAMYLLVDAHAWSLHPFYKRRLQSAYILRRNGERAGPYPYEQPIAFSPIGATEAARLNTEAAAWPGLHRHPPGVPPEASAGPTTPPQLILCCAANLSEVGRVPPGRRAASFTFSSDVIGGPVVGWTRADDYWAALPRGRQADITVPSAMAISGAAFSPAMGKTNLGPVGAALALANLRLGVWLPHPQSIEAGAADGPPDRPGRLRRFIDEAKARPGWPKFFSELANNYPFKADHLYVSDGGHWDNLGLVELLRRGCTEITCVSAAGDGKASFGTLAEAIALAREELGVEIDIDPTPLRAATSPNPVATTTSETKHTVKDVDTSGSTTTEALAVESASSTLTGTLRELRRSGAIGGAEPLAPAAFVTGTYTFPSGVTGDLYVIEAALTPDLPPDVHAFAESEAIFPDDETTDQVFNHRQFESYRRLGQHQADQLLDSLEG